MPRNSSPETRALDDLLESLLLLARTVDDSLKREAIEAVAGKRLSFSMVRVLRLLHRAGGYTTTELSRTLGVSKPAVSQLIDSMAWKKLVFRQRGTTDRRKVGLWLTEKGKCMAQGLDKEQRKRLKSAIAKAGNASAARWARTIQVIASNLTNGPMGR